MLIGFRRGFKRRVLGLKGHIGVIGLQEFIGSVIFGACGVERGL